PGAPLLRIRPGDSSGDALLTTTRRRSLAVGKVGTIADPRRRQDAETLGRLVEPSAVLAALHAEGLPRLVQIVQLISRALEAATRLDELLALDSGYRLALIAEMVTHVSNEMSTDLVHEPRLPHGAPIYGGEHQRRGVHDCSEGVGPRFVVVTRPEVEEQRVREMTLDDIHSPQTPLIERRSELLRHRVLGAGLEQLHTRGRCPGQRVECNHSRLAPLE